MFGLKGSFTSASTGSGFGSSGGAVPSTGSAGIGASVGGSFVARRSASRATRWTSIAEISWSLGIRHHIGLFQRRTKPYS
ncbi:hypothetical protein OV079_36990 [Nannocystis pusilla]|uniref:Uncharacterized protein n=1 Tax=Nannocystis pusilla TaxID=889268 RepID=A0A9X3J1U1_9BACT|nr:hypothetical protein [Nannocystis pusilla]MCY1011069.1 hypothetical protein [Nannocystis pusilla]